MPAPHALNTDALLGHFKTTSDGLSQQQVEARQQRYGPNSIKQESQVSAIKILISQFTSFLVWLLVGAATLSFLIGEEVDAIIILFIVVINAVIGFLQEYKAEQAIQDLKEHQILTAIVRRDGEIAQVDSVTLVPGDILLLSEGQKVPADARILSVTQLEVNESLLTGESKTVSKATNALPEKTVLGDRTNMVFTGTTIVGGKGEAVVCATGNSTEFGKIAELTQKTERNLTPLQLTLNRLGVIIGLVSVGLAVPGLILGWLAGRAPAEIILMAVALAVSAIPEGLPIVVTIALAIGIKRMIKKQVLVRRLAAVEALGSTNIICTDKTGTLTENKMTVKDVFTDQKKTLHQAMILCTDATELVGDPTETALVAYAHKHGVSLDLRKKYPRTDEIPFTSSRQYMLTAVDADGDQLAFIKGAPEKVIEFTTASKDDKQEALQRAEEFAQKGIRVLAFATKKLTQNESHKQLEGFKYIGLVALYDPPREGVKKAIEACHTAGIRTIMITGDHPITAAAIAEQVGIESPEVITGQMMEGLHEKELIKVVKTASIFARISPEQKLHILKALQHNKNFVAMTGDGVNDAPALRQADIGVAVGSGSDLAKETADMIILDDNFVSLVAAIYEGRGIFSNIKKFVTFLLAVNFDEVLLVVMSLLFHLPLPLLPIHLLWLNLVTDSFPALALANDHYEKDIMKLKPYDPRKEIVRGIAVYSVLAGLLAFVASMGSFLLELFVLSMDLPTAQTMTFTVTVMFELLIVFALRSHQRFKKSKPLENKWLLAGVGCAVLFQLFAVYFPWTQGFFKTVPLGLDKWMIILPFSMIGLAGFEIGKRFKMFPR